MTQIKKLQTLIEESNQKSTARMKECETQRQYHLSQIGNTLHPSVPISSSEVIYMLYKKCKYGGKYYQGALDIFRF